MLNFKQPIVATCIFFVLTGCAIWQQDKQQAPTPSTLDNTVYNQSSLNNILHSVSDSLGSKLLFQGIDNKKNYTVVYGLTLQNKPVAVSLLSTPTSNTYFTGQLKSQDISRTIFSNNNGVTHSNTTIIRVSYDEIHNTAAKEYLNSLGFNSTNNFLKRTTYFYKNGETLTLLDYILPDQKTNKFDN